LACKLREIEFELVLHRRIETTPLIRHIITTHLGGPLILLQPRKKYGTYSLGIALLLLGLVGVLVGFRNYLIRLLGLLAIVGGTHLVRISKVHASPFSPVTIESDADTGEKKLSRLLRIIGIALLPMMGFSGLCLYEDALHGYHQAWPLYLFYGVGLACAVVWPYLFATIFTKILR